MKIKISDIKKRLETALKKRGFSAKDAALVTDEYMFGELEGKKSHGLAAFPSLLDKLNTNKKPYKIIKKTHSLLFIEANQNLGVLVANFAIPILVKMAKKEGVAIACIKNMITWLRPGFIAELVANKNMIGIVVNNGGRPMTAPFGGYTPVIGTNPIGIGIPSKNNPMVADMATSRLAWGQVREAEREGKQLPANIFLDKKGSFTKNPKKAYSVIPMGDYKGFAIGLLIEILTGSFLGRKMSLAELKGDYRISTRGGIIIVLDPAKTTNIDSFKRANSLLANRIRESKKLKGVSKIFPPGEKDTKNRVVAIKKGKINVDKKLWDMLI
jgi:LDH2 family malate/lactate/ureidoglycolate dehydrogenase